MISEFKGKHYFLSNFYPCFTEGKTVEHLFQCAKTTDMKWANAIYNTATPEEAKKLGRKCPLIDDWNEKRLSIMVNIVLVKFLTPRLRTWLLETGDEELIKGNTWEDTFWEKCNGAGNNHLGEILMSVRSRLKRGAF